MDGRWETLVLIKASTHRSLPWWNKDNLLWGRPYAVPTPQVTITTDASLTGWDAQLNDMTIQGVWDPQYESHQINYLELLAINLALNTFFQVI